MQEQQLPGFNGVREVHPGREEVIELLEQEELASMGSGKFIPEELTRRRGWEAFAVASMGSGKFIPEEVATRAGAGREHLASMGSGKFIPEEMLGIPVLSARW